MVGVLIIELHPHISNNYLYISSVFVLPEYRRHGIGSCLLGKAKNYATQKKIPAYMTTVKENDGINDYYINRGFDIGG